MHWNSAPDSHWNCDSETGSFVWFLDPDFLIATQIFSYWTGRCPNDTAIGV